MAEVSTSRRPIAAGNWKMNGSFQFATQLASEVASFSDSHTGVDVVIAPVATVLHRVHETLQGHRVGLAAQNVHFAEKGAYTGELSLEMLKDCGCEWVILGHSERRQYFGETDEFVNRKGMAVLRAGLTPIICVGESLEERKSGWTNNKVEMQVRAALSGLTDEEVYRVVIAYEPLWAIGTGETATPEQAEEVHAHIRQVVERLYGEKCAAAIRILYGGSVKPSNIKELIAQPDIDGALVGGASLKSADFEAIVKGCAESVKS